MKHRFIYRTVVTMLMTLFAAVSHRATAGNPDEEYAKLWTKVEEYQGKGQPKSAIEVATKIRKKAAKEGNYGQELKAELLIMVMRQDIAPDSVVVDLQRMEQLPVLKAATEGEATQQKVKRALTHTVLASAYQKLKYVQAFSQNEDLQAENEARMQAHTAAALEEKDVLVGADAAEFQVLYKAGSDSRLYQNDAFSLIVRFLKGESLMDEVQLWELLKWGAEAYEQKGMRNAAVLMKLDALKAQRELKKRSLALTSLAYADAVKKLYEENLDTEAGADACLAYLQGWNRLNYQEEYDLAEDAKKRWANTPMRQNFEILQEKYMAPELSVSVSGASRAKVPFQVVVSHRNVKSVTLRVVPNPRSDAMKGYPSKQLPDPIVLNFDSYSPDNCESLQYDTLSMTLPAGSFQIVGEDGKVTNYCTAHLASVKMMNLNVPEEGKLVCVVDATTGRPVANCEVEGKWEERVGSEWKTFTKTYKTNAEGQAKLDDKVTSAYAKPSKYDWTESLNTRNGVSFYTPKPDTRYEVFTDRAIYRPGQTVFMSGFVFYQDGDQTKAVPHAKVQVALYDANSQLIKKEERETDDFGSVSAQFVIPTDRLNGEFSVRMGSNHKDIRVEEYKRPTFTVEFDPVEGNFSLGDTVTLHAVAKTYSGVPVQGAKVKYTQQWCETSYWSWWYGQQKWNDLAADETETDDDGRFSIRMALNNDTRTSLLMFRTQVDVTDQAGETHGASTTLRVANEDFALRISMGDNVEAESKDETSVKVEAINAQQQNVAAKGTWSLLSYSRVKKSYDIEVANGTFTAGQPFPLPNTANLPLGSYCLKVQATDSKDHTMTDSHTFVLWSQKRNEDMNLKEDWLLTRSTTINENRPIDVWFAPAQDDAYLYAYAISTNKVLKKQIGEQKGRKMTHHRIDFTEELRQGAAIQFAYVKDDKTYRVAESFTYEKPDKQLKLAWRTFRDKLLPGQEETWTLTILDKDDKPVPAQLLATMYDKSLDAFVSHSLPMSLYFSRNCPSFGFSHTDDGHHGGFSLRYNKGYLSMYSRRYNDLYNYSHYSSLYRKGYGHLLTTRYRAKGAGSPVGAALGASPNAALAVEEADEAPMMLREVAYDSMADKKVLKAETSAEEKPQGEVKLRENFNETAFFYPDLVANEKGEVSFTFTLPDCLTEWQFMGLAHTANIDYGHLSSTVVARKDFMVQPNMPRFVRMDDRVNITSRIINQSEKTINGTAYIKLIDPETEQEVFTDQATFKVEAGKTTNVGFDYTVTEQYPMLICEITAQGGNFSDGERNYLPVLTSKKVLYETVPFYVQGNGTKDIDISSLFNGNSPTATQRHMTIDYTDNPSWTAVLALHAVVNPEYDNAIAWSAALYANTVAQHLASRMPQLQTLIEKWSQEKGEETTLQSELEKNQELKEILLQESPWMLEAQDETRQRKTICELFDKQLLNKRIEQATKKLKQLQYSNGGWGWFQEMPPSYYTTLATCSHLAQLYHYLVSQNVANKTVHDMLKKGLQFLDKEELESYRDYYKKHKKVLPSESSCHYLYTKAISGIDTGNGAADKMRDDYLNRIERRPTQLTIYGRANTAVILLLYQRMEKALELVKSLREYTVQRPGYGRYYDTERAYYSWMDYRMPTHIAAMRAMMLSKANFDDAQQYLTEMQLWLLRQKQVQKWDSEINTINAVDLLLSISPETTFHEVRTPKVTVGQSPLTLNPQTAGIGYTKTVVADSIVAGQPQTVTVSLAEYADKMPTLDADLAAMTSWGCVYGQCLESLSNVKASEGSLTITRQAYLQVAEGNGTKWVAIQEGQALHVGDKVRIRHTITADRDMDFVQVRSQHAACLEHIRTLSGYQKMGGRWGYLSLHDASADLFFDCFRKGSATLDLELYVTRTGHYQNGIATVQCAYAPAFSGHSGGSAITVE